MSLDPPLGANRLTRINRDMRFAKDKTPYHTRISTVVRGCYLSLSADGLYVGTGLYMPEPPTLRRMREAIAADASGRKLVSLVAGCVARATTWERTSRWRRRRVGSAGTIPAWTSCA